MRRTFAIILLIVASNTLWGQIAKYSNDFLNIGVGAKWLAMGNSGVALSNSIESAYWNPSGLAVMDKQFEVGAMHASHFAGMASFNHLGFAYKPDTLSALAFTIIRFGVDDIPNTTELIDADGNFSYDRLKLFSVADYAFLISYARKLPVEGLSVGGNAKIIYRNVGKFANAWGFGIDASARYQTGKWSFGANYKDATSTLNIWSFNAQELEITIGDSTFNQIPETGIELTAPQLHVGAARHFQISQNISLSAELGSMLFFDGKRAAPLSTKLGGIDPTLGVEVGYMNLVYVRAGINNLQKVQHLEQRNGITLQPNIGLGISFRGISLDYALTNVGSTGFSRYSNIFSLQWEFNNLKKR